MGKLGNALRNRWRAPESEGLSLDGTERLLAHRRILDSNPVLRNCYLHWYRELLRPLSPDELAGKRGELLELGSGVGFLEEMLPSAIRTDVLPNPFASRILDATRMDLPDGTVGAFLLVGVFHHFPDIRAFLGEAQRCLRPGGKIVLVEPTNGLMERILCRILGHYEHFDLGEGPEWRNPGALQMTGANLGLPWIVFRRDRGLFHERFPFLKIRQVRFHTFLTYFVSGGMTYRPFIPTFLIPLLNVFEWLLSPFMRLIGNSMTVVIEKTDRSAGS